MEDKPHFKIERGEVPQELIDQEQRMLATMELSQDIEDYRKAIKQIVMMMKKNPAKRDQLYEEFSTLKRELTYRYAMLKAITDNE